jgi:hypothetical protein
MKGHTMNGGLRISLVAGLLGLCVSSASARLRIVTYNITNYSGGRVTELQTIIYGEFEGRSMAPDVILTQEFLSQAAADSFLDLLNTAPNSPGDWAAAPFIDGRDTDSAFFYRTSKVTFLGVTVVAEGGVDVQPRNIQRYDIIPVGYDSPAATLACYSTHMKSGTASSDQARRLIEAQRIRDDAEMLPVGWHFLLGGDLNIQTSTQSAYVELVGSQANNDGRFWDPIDTPGSWNNNGAFRFVHTQDPIGAGGMDDRHDQLLVSESLVDGEGFDYIGEPTIPYSTTTWNDANHSYRSWGNDGTSFNTTLTIANNQMVGATIAQALVDAAVGAGHLPVFLDLRVPPEIDSDAAIDFGQVAQDSVAEATLTVTNAGDVSLWSAAGIADLHYSLQTTTGFTVAGGPFVDPPDGAGNAHTVTMDTSTIGPVNGTLTISSDAPDEPIRIVALTGEVVAAGCPGDLNGDGYRNATDFTLFVSAYGSHVGDPNYNLAADLNGDGFVNASDFTVFASNYNVPCP